MEVLLVVAVLFFGGLVGSGTTYLLFKSRFAADLKRQESRYDILWDLHKKLRAHHNTTLRTLEGITSERNHWYKKWKEK